MKTRILLVLFVPYLLIITACNNAGKMIKGPDGEVYYELPKARSVEEHCSGASIFSMSIASQRFHIEIRDGKQFLFENDKEAVRKDLESELEGIATFTEEGKRNYSKIMELFNRIIMTDEFRERTPEDVRKEIYQECTFKMAHGTWFKKPPSP